MRVVLTITNPRILPSKSLLVGEVPSTYSTILTPRPPVSDRGDRMLLAASLPGKLPDLLGTIVIGWETAWSATQGERHGVSKCVLAYTGWQKAGRGGRGHQARRTLARYVRNRE